MLELVCLHKSLQQWRTLKEVRLMGKQLRKFSFDDEGANKLCCQTYLLSRACASSSGIRDRICLFFALSDVAVFC